MTPKYYNFVVAVGADEVDVAVQEMLELVEDVRRFEVGEKCRLETANG